MLNELEGEHSREAGAAVGFKSHVEQWVIKDKDAMTDAAHDWLKSEGLNREQAQDLMARAHEKIKKTTKGIVSIDIDGGAGIGFSIALVPLYNDADGTRVLVPIIGNSTEIGAARVSDADFDKLEEAMDRRAAEQGADEEFDYTELLNGLDDSYPDFEAAERALNLANLRALNLDAAGLTKLKADMRGKREYSKPTGRTVVIKGQQFRIVKKMLIGKMRSGYLLTLSPIFDA
jgi:hypothetical protein